MRYRFLAGAVAVLMLTSLYGCGRSSQAYHEVPKGTRVHDDPHSHEAGPHGGHIVELGEEEYHAEVVFDPNTSKVTIYILDSTAKKPQPIDAKQVTLVLAIKGKPKPFAAAPVPDTGDPKGSTSRFEINQNPDIKEHIKTDEDLKGQVGVTINEKPYTGQIVHEH